jgi:malonyl-CoA/methylmalonyl-CoA synthetase
MSNQNLFALFETRVPRDLGQPWLETDTGLIYTWRDMLHASARLAGWLASLNLPADGFPPRIAVQVEKSPEALLLYLAALRAGVVYLPLNTAYQRAELDYFLRDAQPAVLVCAPEREDELQPIAQSGGCRHVVTLGTQRNGSLLTAATRFPDLFATVRRAASDLAAILYTSGTTGRSKGAMLTHGNLASNALVLDEFWGFREERESAGSDAGVGDVLLHALPLFHVHGLFVAVHTAMLAAARMIFLAKFDPATVLRLLPRATVFMGVPTYYTRLLAEHGLDRHRCRNMRLFVAGSAPLLPDTFEAFRNRTGHAIVERYGMSETGMLVSNPYFGTPRDRIAGTVGVPLPGVLVRVVDDEGRPCAVGEIGHVQVKGPNVFSGYWRMPEKTREEFTADGWFRTADMGCFGAAAKRNERTEGKPDNYLTLVGRSKDLIISGGYNVYPKEIESYLDALPGVEESAVFGVPHPDFGEAVAAVLVPKAGAHIDTTFVLTQLKSSIANFKVPKRLWTLDALPRNAMGKVQKNVLRERFSQTFGRAFSA